MSQKLQITILRRVLCEVLTESEAVVIYQRYWLQRTIWTISGVFALDYTDVKETEEQALRKLREELGKNKRFEFYQQLMKLVRQVGFDRREAV